MMHEKLISELEAMGKIAQNNRLMHWESIYLPQAAAALRELLKENERLKGKIVTPSGGTTFIECEDCKTFTRASRHLDSDCKTIADLRAKLKACEEESSEYEEALDAVWVNDGKWNYETHQESDTGVNGFTIATGDIEANTYKRLVYNAESPLDAILAALKGGKHE